MHRTRLYKQSGNRYQCTFFRSSKPNRIQEKKHSVCSEHHSVIILIQPTICQENTENGGAVKMPLKIRTCANASINLNGRN